MIMDLKRDAGIKAGLGGGILIAVIFVIANVANLLLSSSTSAELGESDYALICGEFTIFAIILLATGVISVRMALPELRSATDVLSTTVVAGTVAGAIYGVTAIVLNLISSIIYGSALAAVLICGCGVGLMVIIIVVAIILSFIGGIVCWVLSPKPPRPSPPFMPPASPPTPPAPPGFM